MLPLKYTDEGTISFKTGPKWHIIWPH